MYQKSLTGFFTAIAIYCLSLPPHGEAGLNHFSRGPFDEQGIQLVSVSRSPFDEQGIQIVSMSRNPFDEQGIQIVSIDRDPFNEQGVQIVSIDRDPFDEWGIQIISIEKSPCTKQGMQMIAGLLPRLKILPSILGDEENCFKAGIFQNQAEEDADASAEGEAEGEQDEDYLSQIEVRTTDIPDDLREDVLQLEEDLKIKMYQTDELYRKLTGTNNHIAQLEGRMKAREKKLPPWLAKLLLGDHLLIDEYRRYKKHRDELQKSLEKSQREDWLADRAIRQTISEWLNKRDQQFAELNDIMKSLNDLNCQGRDCLEKTNQAIRELSYPSRVIGYNQIGNVSVPIYQPHDPGPSISTAQNATINYLDNIDKSQDELGKLSIENDVETIDRDLNKMRAQIIHTASSIEEGFNRVRNKLTEIICEVRDNCKQGINEE